MVHYRKVIKYEQTTEHHESRDHANATYHALLQAESAQVVPEKIFDRVFTRYMANGGHLSQVTLSTRKHNGSFPVSNGLELLNAKHQAFTAIISSF